MGFKGFFAGALFILTSCLAIAQDCPVNIGFESGTFSGWKCYIGNLEYNTAAESASLRSTVVPPDGQRHVMYTNTSPQELDPYGQFPVNCPNGSQHSIRLGDSGISGNGRTNPAFCERVTYDFTVPTDDYTLICYYAVVFQDPGHPAEQQPKLIANVHNLDDPSDDARQCGAFNFTAQAGLQGFEQSRTDKITYYKPWSALVIKISGRQGKHFQLEFITHDCSQGGHFGYAYLDFNEGNCNSPITGNLYCPGQSTIKLTAPPGFQTYVWTDDAGNTLSNTPTLQIPAPFPPDGTKYNLSIVPYFGLGCANAFTTTIQKLDESYNLQVLSSYPGCKADGIDLTDPKFTAGSSPGMKFEYYTDKDGQDFLSDPKYVTETGDYYIRGTNGGGCTDIAKIHLDLFDGPKVDIAAHPAICYPATYDITKLVSSAEPVTYSYYSDYPLKTLISDPHMINKTGTYYVKAVSKLPGSCATVEPIALIVSALPAGGTQTYSSCPPLSLNTAVGNSGDGNGGVTYRFYTDARATLAVTDPDKVTISGTYYFIATNQYGCDGPLGKVIATVYPTPDFKVTAPDAVMYPQTVNLSYTHIPLTYAEFSYWKDAACTKTLENYQTISESGTYYIRAINATGCIVIHPVHVLIDAPPEANLIVANTITPNGDGINDDFKPVTEGVLTLNYIRIFNRYGKQIFETKHLYDRWDGSVNGKPEPSGTYYWVFSAYDIYRKKLVTKSGSITIVR